MSAWGVLVSLQLSPATPATPQAVGRSRQVRGACPRLFRDLLAVLCGLRPGFMLDYGSLQPVQLAAAVAALAAGLALPAAGLALVLLNDCCYLVRPGLLPDPLAGAAPDAEGSAAAGGQQQQQGSSNSSGAPPMLFVAFDQHRPRWAASAEASEAAGQLAALQRGLLDAVHAADPAAAERQPQRQQQEAPSGGGIPVVDAADVAGWQALAPPTASGYLLGYPALYLVRDLEGAQAASRGLSTGGLCLHTVACALQPGSGVPAPEGQPLLAFSVPGELAVAPAWAACRDAWWALLQRQRSEAAGAGWPWGEPALEMRAQPPRPVAL